MQLLKGRALSAWSWQWYFAVAAGPGCSNVTVPSLRPDRLARHPVRPHRGASRSDEAGQPLSARIRGNSVLASRAGGSRLTTLTVTSICERGCCSLSENLEAPIWPILTLSQHFPVILSILKLVKYSISFRLSYARRMGTCTYNWTTLNTIANNSCGERGSVSLWVVYKLLSMWDEECRSVW